MDLETLKKQREETLQKIIDSEEVERKARLSKTFLKKHLKLIEEEIDELKDADTEQEKE